jgi:hypothetical protein
MEEIKDTTSSPNLLLDFEFPYHFTLLYAPNLLSKSTLKTIDISNAYKYVSFAQAELPHPNSV